MSQSYTIRTDSDGLFNDVTHFDSPVIFAITVHDVCATITSHPNLTVDGSVDLADGSNKHTTAKLNASTGQKIPLGTWHITHSGNILTIAGKTVPPTPNADVVVEMDHS
ncbi:MAG: hypothetical protein ACLQU2_24265 [Candidatus Binataceae bacterium]